LTVPSFVPFLTDFAFFMPFLPFGPLDGPAQQWSELELYLHTVSGACLVNGLAGTNFLAGFSACFAFFIFVLLVDFTSYVQSRSHPVQECCQSQEIKSKPYVVDSEPLNKVSCEGFSQTAGLALNYSRGHG
jgi:hypothetical protein